MSSDLNIVIRQAKRSDKKELDLSNREIETLPMDIYKITSLLSLNLAYNKLTDLDRQIDNLRSLQDLDLSYNNFIDLPTEILGLSNLSILKLKNNPIYMKCKDYTPTNWKASLKKVLLGKIGGAGDSVETTSSLIWMNNDNLAKTSLYPDNSRGSNKILSSTVANFNVASFNNNKVDTGDSEAKISDLESQLQKETLNTKRLKKEVDRLKEQLANSGGINLSNKSSDFLLQSVREINFEEISLEKKIGEGGFSIIYKANWNGTDTAVKLIFDPKVTEDLLEEFNNEIKMLSYLRHPNIILLIGICTNPQKLSIITEYFEGSLFDFMHRTNKDFSLKDKIKILRQVAKAMNFIHYNGIVHRDLKSQNILVDDYLNAKLCDFGLAKNKNELNWGTGKFSGTPTYMAPELFDKKAYDEKVDIFAFGTLMWEMLVRKVPYEGFEISDIRKKTLTDEKLFIPKTVNAEMGNLIHSCRAFDPSKRPTFKEILDNLNLYNL